MRALITGITGFVGSHLAEFLLEKNYEVFGSVRWRSKRDNIAHLEASKSITLFETDIKDPLSVRQTVSESRPDEIYHLAAQSFVPASWSAPAETLDTNIQGQLNILEAAREVVPDARVHVVGSSEEYGLVYPDEVPIDEDQPLRPMSPYGVSKVAQDMLGWQYFQSFGMNIIRTRAFNHTGPRRGEVFVTSNFAKQLAEIKKGKQKPVIKVGNLEAKRDFTDVRDTIKAYHLAVTRSEPGSLFNIASGTGRSIQSVLDLLLEISGLDVRVEQDPMRMRPSDVMVLEGSYKRINQALGWEPVIPFEKTMKDLYEFWLERV
ncbi:MAG TPA: SDR family oxidoreductase [Firmicutes bacterium]|nr:SDR family oxidoreductase [Bacillota bacterium]